MHPTFLHAPHEDGMEEISSDVMDRVLDGLARYEPEAHSERDVVRALRSSLFRWPISARFSPAGRRRLPRTDGGSGAGGETTALRQLGLAVHAALPLQPLPQSVRLLRLQRRQTRSAAPTSTWTASSAS